MIGKLIRNVIRLSCLYVSLQGINYTNLVTKYAPQPNQYARFGGNYRQAGFCLLTLLLVNITLLFISDIFPERRKLRHVSGALFTNVTRPICLIYCFMIWSFSLCGSQLLVHWNQSRWSPKWYSHTQYTFPACYVIVESCIQSHASKGYWNAFKLSMSTLFLFIIWQSAILLLENRKPNRVFELKWWKQLLFIGYMVSLEFIFLGIGYFIDWAIFNLPEDEIKETVQTENNRIAVDEDGNEEVEDEFQNEIETDSNQSETLEKKDQ